MKKRVLAAALALILVLTGAASALTVEQAGEVLQAYYIDEVPQQALEQDTIDGMLAVLGDPYTEYFSAEEFAAYMSTMEDTSIVGIGIRSYYLEEGLYVVEVVPDSPAAQAGLQVGDYLIAIDGHDTRGADSDQIDSWLLGEEGSELTLTVLRGEERFETTAVRAPVVFRTAQLQKVEDGVGWIVCTAFGQDTFADFYEIITAWDDQVDMWVVDLRDNGGGDVMAAAFAAGCFSGSGQGVYSRDRAGQYTAWFHDPAYIVPWGYYDGELTGFDQSGCLTRDPVLVLVNENTASASELFACSIRDSGAGLVIGARTFGKAVMQTIFTQEIDPDYFTPGDPADYFAQGDAIKVTTERVYSMQGSTHDTIGIMPHVLVDPDLADEVAALLAASVEEGEDTLTVRGLNDISRIASSFVIPLDMLGDAAYTEAAGQLLSALPPDVRCTLSVDGVQSTVTPAQAAEAVRAAYAGRAFTDTADSPYGVQIDTLGTYGIVSGPGDGTFRPDDTLDRASLCALLAKALRCPAGDGETTFADVPADAWYAPYVDALCQMGFMEGYDDGLFHPDDPISHEQFVALMDRVGRWLNMDLYELAREDGLLGDLVPSDEQLAEQFGAFSPWARQAAWLVNEFAWERLDGEVDAQAPTTRGEAAATLYNLFYISGVLNV